MANALAAQDDQQTPTPKRGRVRGIHDLTTLRGLQSQMRKVYRLIHTGKLDHAKGCKEIWALGEIVRNSALIEIEARQLQIEEGLRAQEIAGNRTITADYWPVPAAQREAS